MELPMQTQPVRLTPGSDLRDALESLLAHHGCRAAFVVAGIGSLQRARIRLAGRAEPDSIEGDLEILTFAGTLAPDGAHLHMSVADASGRVVGGHVSRGCIVRTTAEVLVALLPDWSFEREHDPGTGYAELVVRGSPRGGQAAGQS
jgi:predicted DNA-binding protein with PD1-like motif